MTHQERMKTEEDALVYLDERWCEQENVGIELIELAQRAIELHPNSSRLLVMYGILLQLGPDPNAEKSLASFKRALELDPKNVQAWCELGAVFDINFENPAAAEAAFLKAISLGGSVDTYTLYARLLAETRREREGLELLKTCPWPQDRRVLKMYEEIERGEWSL